MERGRVRRLPYATPAVRCMTGSQRSASTGKTSPQTSLVAPAILSALSLALPAALYVVAAADSISGTRAMSATVAVAIVAMLGIIYVALVVHARRSGPAILAGVAASLSVVGVLGLLVALLFAKLDATLGGSGSGVVVLVPLVFIAVQYMVARWAKRVAGPSRRLRSEGAFQLGVAVPLLFAMGVSAARGIPRSVELQQFVADNAARDRARADLFALYACADAHHARDPHHDYPATLEALGASGERCLPASVASGKRGDWTFAYTARPSTDDSAAAFTVRATPSRTSETATMLTIDQHGIIREDWLTGNRTPLFRPDPPGLDMLLAIRECEHDYRLARRKPPAGLNVLRAFADSSRLTAVTRCIRLRNLGGRLEWAQYGRPVAADEWTGKEYHLAFHPRYTGDSSLVAWEARPVTFGATGVWSYLALSSGAIHGTTESRAATTDDAIIPRCEFGAPPAGSGQCVPGSSPPPNATLVVDSVVDARGFTVRLVDATDSTAEGTAAGFEYAFSCDGLENNNFVRDSSRTCRAQWSADSVSVTARIRNRDLAVREYTRRVRVRQPRLATELARPDPIVLGDVLELDARDATRNPREIVEYTIRIGDAPPETRSFPANRALLHCRAATSQQAFDCAYPAKPGKYDVRLTAHARTGDTTLTTQALISAPQLLRLPATTHDTVHAAGNGEYLVVELLANWPAEHGQTRLVRDAVGAGDIGPEPPHIGTVQGIYAERAERASDGRTVVPIAFRWSELLESGAVVPGTRALVLSGRRGHVHDFVPYKQLIPVTVEK